MLDDSELGIAAFKLMEEPETDAAVVVERTGAFTSGNPRELKPWDKTVF